MEMLKGSHFMCEMSLTHSRLTGYKFTSGYMVRLMSSGWLVFESQRNHRTSTQEGSSSDDDDDNTRKILLSNSSDSETRAAIVAATRIAEDARVAGISSTARTSRRAGGLTDEALQAMLVPEADLASGSVVAPDFGELIAGCEGLFAALRRMLVNSVDPLAGVSGVSIFYNH